MSFITKRHVPRRLFLKASGVTLALPLLEAMVPARTLLAQTAAAPKQRFASVFFPHGMAPGFWEPAAQGALPAKLPFILESLEKVKDQTVVLSGLWSKSAEPPEGTTGSDHWVAAAFLTGIKPRKTAAADATVGSPTIDQFIAQKIGNETLLPSLQLSLEDPNSSSSNCGEGYSCSYTNSISWVGLPTPPGEPLMRTAPLPMELNPQVVFERLFGSGGTPELRAQRLKQTRSILDSLTSELSRLKNDLGASDQRTINQYTDEIREIERRIQIAAEGVERTPELDLPPGIPGAVRRAREAALRPAGTRVQGRHHARGDGPRRARPYRRVYLFPTQPAVPGRRHQHQFSRWIAPSGRPGADPAVCRAQPLSRLDHGVFRREAASSIPDGDGTLLDNSLILYGTNMGNSNQHQHYDVPHILVGGATGKLKGNRHLGYERKSVTTGNLLLSLMDMYGRHQHRESGCRATAPE